MSIIHALSASSGRLKRLTIGAGRNRGGRKGKSLSDKKLRLTRSRLVILAATFSLAYVAIFGKLAYYGMTPDDAGSAIPPAPTVAFRPDIVDRNGQILATDIRTVSMYAEPYRVVDPDEAVEKLASIFPDLDRKALFQKLSDKRSHFAWLRRQLTPKEQSEVLGLGLPAIGFRPDVRRFYPGGRTAAHIVGYVDIDNHGVAGMEKYIDQQGMSDLAATGLTSTDDLKPVKLSMTCASRTSCMMSSPMHRPLSGAGGRRRHSRHPYRRSAGHGLRAGLRPERSAGRWRQGVAEPHVGRHG